MKKSSVLLACACILFLCAIGFIAYGKTRIPQPRFRSSLHDLLPPVPAGWTMKEQPIAETPEMQKAVGELLNFDDGIFVNYLGPAGERLSVYIAYWTPGKMSHRLVAGHTPDICWVGNGWEKTASARTPDLQLDSALASAQGGSPTKVPPGEARIFTANGTPEHVWFWHLVGNESKSYGTGYVPPWHAAITDMLSKGLNQREEQFFIRLSANQPLEQFINGPLLPAVLRNIPWSGPTG